MATAKSKKQQMAAGAALAAKRGERSKSSLKGASKGMVESMSEEDLGEMASAPRKKLPRRATKKTGSSRASAARKTKSKTAARKKMAKRTRTKRKSASKR
jgi:Protein of unknwon function (DUF3008)